jgi:hypothetical protein
MEPIIKRIKNELKPLRKEYMLRLKHINNRYQEILEYTNYYGLNFKKHNLVCRFILQKKENTISFTYSYICDKRNCDVFQEYSFLSDDIDVYPCFPEDDVLKIKKLYEFETENNEIKNRVSLDKQADVILNVFMKRYKKLTNFVKNQETSKEV